MNDGRFIGINKDYKFDLVISAIAASVFILLGKINPIFIIGTPLDSSYFSFVRELSLFDKFLITVIIAPILEEFFFRFFLHGSIATILENYGVKRNISLVITILVVSVCFSAFHISAYGNILHFAYLGAFLFSVIASALMVLRQSQIINTALHLIINLSVLYGIFVIV